MMHVIRFRQNTNNNILQYATVPLVVWMHSLLLLPLLLLIVSPIPTSSFSSMDFATRTSTIRKKRERIFQQQQQRCTNHNRVSKFDQTKLYGISEWRDTMFDYLPGSSTDGLPLGDDKYTAPPKEICVLPFPFDDVLVQGETKQLRLYEQRFIKLFQYSMEKHSGVVAMGLLAESGIVQTVPICEIEAYNDMSTDTSLGIFVTIRVIGRAKLIDISQQTPYIKAVCEEIIDTIPPNLELPNLLASNIENLMLLLSSMEYRYEQEIDNKKKKKTSLDGNKSDDTDDDEEDRIMKRRIELAKLEDTFYEEDMGDDNESDNDDDDDEEEDSIPIDRRRRFRRACEIALATDTQGYQGVQQKLTTPSSTSSSTTTLVDDDTDSGTTSQTTTKINNNNNNSPQKQQEEQQRSAQELTAISWGAFCTDLYIGSDIETITYKIQALDSTKLFDRLKLAYQMLRKKHDRIRAKLQTAGISLSSSTKASSSSSAETATSNNSNKKDGATTGSITTTDDDGTTKNKSTMQNTTDTNTDSTGSDSAEDGTGNLQ